MIEWLTVPIDPSRTHAVGEAIAWHGRLMVLAWGFVLPLGVFFARFFKITRRQNWPHHVDNKLWWHVHLTTQYIGGMLMLAGFGLVLLTGAGAARWNAHGLVGYAVVALGVSQFVAGWMRGSKGGPTEATLRGDHYDMTRRRRIFEYVHKTFGYVALLLGAGAIVTGLWHANAPRWMWGALGGWWCIFLAAFIWLQQAGHAIDTYQAIWGPDPRHPGNGLKPIGWGVRRWSPAAGE